MPTKLIFDPAYLHSVAGGKSALDTQRLHLSSIAEAEAFMRGYGFDPAQEKDIDQLWDYYRRAYVLITEKLGYAESEIPEVFRDKKDLKTIQQLLLFASQVEAPEFQRWACALLRAMHVFIHSENDLFSSYSSEIQQQILTSFEERIYYDGNSHKTFLKGTASVHDDVELHSFEVKPFKTSTSTVFKLLAKPEALAMRVYDKLGVRFVTKNIFDSFQVVRLLVEENLISYPHIMPEQSSNNVYPVKLFIEVCDQLLEEGRSLTSEQISEKLERQLSGHPEQIEVINQMFRKENHFSGLDYRFIKFITRQLVHIQKNEKETFSFFYPYEVQIMDFEAYQKVLSGPSEHVAYKERQKAAARKRLFPE